MYCNKIILRAWLPNHHFRDIPLILGKLSPLISHLHNENILLFKHSLSGETVLHSQLRTAAAPSSRY